MTDYLTPISSGLTPAPAGTGVLSRERDTALQSRLRELEQARRFAAVASRSYVIRGAT